MNTSRLNELAHVSSDEKTWTDIAPINVITGDDYQSRYLYYQLKLSMQNAERIDIIVSFLMESGVRMLLSDMQAALDRGAKIRILTGNYLGITQPSALYLIKGELGDRVDLRLYNDSHRSFHPKSYIFHRKDHSEMFIGSSNISRSAMTSGIEWNYRFTSTQDKKDFDQFYHTFEDLFENHSIKIDDQVLREYSKSWHRPAVQKDLDRYDLLEDAEDQEREPIVPLFQPRGAQIEALYALRDTREEGAQKALVCGATGFGKTYVAAFDSASFKRVLFVAHREEILKQAARAFANVRGDREIGFFMSGNRDTYKDVVFASVATLGKPEYLNDTYFTPDHFDYLILDEIHHGVTKQYQNILHYFKPQFTLGLTATPERMDGKSVYALCDYNVPFEISMKEAINKGMLVPFHYYGIYDETDYSTLRLIKGKYAEADLDKTYIGNERRYDLIFKYYQKYRSKRAMGFCVSRKHAEDMAREFAQRGVSAAAVYSNADGDYSMDREQAIDDLKNGKLKVLFCVDMFNEGLDVPDLDMVMFLRPTESPIVFMQQLGRGLRKARGKEYLTVLDFIGNYAKAGLVQTYLRGDGGRRHGTGNGSSRFGGREESEFPDDCLVDFDMQLIDLFKKMSERTAGIEQRIKEEFLRVEDMLGHVPTRMELFTNMDDDIYDLCLAHTSKNPFRAYMRYLKGLNALSKEQEEVYNGIGREFLELVETTSMSKVYKMPVMMSFLEYDSNDEVCDVHMHVKETEVLKTWKEFFNRGTNWKDLDPKSSHDKYKKLSDTWHLSKIKKMPINFLVKSGKGFFLQEDGAAISLNASLEDVAHEPEFARQFADILEYRITDYYRRRYICREEAESGNKQVLLFSKKVDKSLLKQGTTIPKGKVDDLLRECNLELKHGGKTVLKVELDEQMYPVQLTSLDFQKKYDNREIVQIRYNESDPICVRIKELVQELDGAEGILEVYAVGISTVRFVLKEKDE